MATQSGAAHRKVVIDAGAAIKLQRLERFGGELYTTSGVYAEVRDEKARALLQTLPQELRTREPLPQDIAYAKQFAKATGDLGFLSQNDLSLIALTVLLHREAGGKLRDRPATLSTEEGSAAFDWAPAKPAAQEAKDAQKDEKANAELRNEPADESSRTDQQLSAPGEETGREATEEPAEAKAPKDGEAAEDAAQAVDHFAGAGTAVTAEDIAAAVAEAEAADDDDDDGWEPARGRNSRPAPAPEVVDDDDEDSQDGDSAGEWVTPDNMHRFGISVAAPADLGVTCATADYSVQNVLLQMGITPLTFDGYAVQTVKLWGLVCRACFHFCRDTEKVFCPKCGHDTVVRVPIIVGPDGKPTVMNNGRKLRRKGTVYSVPKPQGGRGWKPIFAEDEIRIGGRDRELRHAQKQSEKERLAKDPFNEDNGARQWWQRSSGGGNARPGQSGGPRMQAGYGRRTNPNANNFKGFGRKKK